MSSTYRILCVSHNPAIALDTEYQTADGASKAVRDIEAIEYQDEELRTHANCDLVLGRRSGALVEIGCARHGLTSGGYHRETKWIGVEQIRLFAAVAQIPTSVHPGIAEIAQKARGRCWTPNRLTALRYELGTPSMGESTPAPWPANASTSCPARLRSGNITYACDRGNAHEFVSAGIESVAVHGHGAKVTWTLGGKNAFLE